MKKKVIDGVCFIDFQDPCSFLDVEKMECMVYERRFEFCRECKKMNILHPFTCSYLPDTCGYVEFFKKGGWFKYLKSFFSVKR